MVHILIAEDVESVADFMLKAVEYAYPEAKVDWVSTGTEALKQLQENTYDLLITDLRLPGLSGLSLIESGRKYYPQLAVILVTAYATQDIEKRVVDMGVDAYLQKPFSLEHLTACIKPLISHKIT